MAGVDDASCGTVAVVNDDVNGASESGVPADDRADGPSETVYVVADASCAPGRRANVSVVSPSDHANVPGASGESANAAAVAVVSIGVEKTTAMGARTGTDVAPDDGVTDATCGAPWVAKKNDVGPASGSPASDVAPDESDAV